MTTRWTAATLALTALVPVAAGEIVTVRFDMPTTPLAIFGLQWTGDYADPAKVGTIAASRLHIEYDTSHPAGSHPDAALLLFQMQLPTTQVPFWDVPGRDLGWAGQGAFVGDLSTSAFNGQELLIDPHQPLPGQLQLWFGRILSDDPNSLPLGGALTDSYWEFDIEVVPGPMTGLVMLGLFAVPHRRR